jgi:hypothetical protein
VRRPCLQRALSIPRITGVGEIEALVAEREVGELVAAQRHGQAEPVVQARIHDINIADFPLVVGGDHVHALASPAFDEAHGNRGRPQGRQRSPQGTAAVLLQTLAHERQRALDLEPALHRARHHVTGIHHGHRDVRVTVDSVRMRVPHVARQPARAGSGTHQSEDARLLAAQRARLLEARHDRRCLECDGRGFTQIALRLAQAIEQRGAQRLIGSEAHAAGHHEPASEPIARQLHQHVEELAAQTSEP